LRTAERKHSARFESSRNEFESLLNEREDTKMKVATITLAMAFALSSSGFALARSNGSSGFPNGSMTRSFMNDIPASNSQDRVDHATVDGPNGHGISHLGVTTNPGRMYNGA
jgi:hypothetical protein